MNNHNNTYHTFTRQEWLNFRQDAPMTLTRTDLALLQGQMQAASMTEVVDIYLPLSRLLSFYVTTAQGLHQSLQHFIRKPEPKVPYIIGVAGSVAVGKSMTSRILQALLSRWPDHPRVQVVTTDGFLYPTAVLEARGLMHRKGFPESYDVSSLIQFLQAVKSGQERVTAPVYSHQTYDIVKDEVITIEKPNILIVEGVNILQTVPRAPLSVSDFFDFSIFVDADTAVIRQWYIERVIKFSQTSFCDPSVYFHFLSTWSEERVRIFAEQIWRDINEINLLENILPTCDRAQLILRKNSDHAVCEVRLRKL